MTEKSKDQNWFLKKLAALVGKGDTDSYDEAEAYADYRDIKAKAETADALKDDNEALKTKNADLEQKLAELKGEVEETDEEIEAKDVAAKETALQAAIDKYRITAAQKDAWLEDYSDKPAEKLKAALERIPEGAAKPGGSGSPEKPSSRASVKASLNPQVAKDLGIK